MWSRDQNPEEKMGTQNLRGEGKSHGGTPNPFLEFELYARRGSERHFPWDLKYGGGLLGVRGLICLSSGNFERCWH